jgi:predicted TIM-barrel fold metal-dependent hydrolase
MSGVLPRHPGVRFVSVESGMGWVPFMLESLDYGFGYSRVAAEKPEYELRPSDYFHRQVLVCAFFEEVAPQRVLDVVGVDNVLFETDYPHPVCLYGNVRDKIDAAYGGHPPDVQRKVLWDNAAALYGVGAPDRPWREGVA